MGQGSLLVCIACVLRKTPALRSLEVRHLTENGIAQQTVGNSTIQDSHLTFAQKLYFPIIFIQTITAGSSCKLTPK